MKISIVTAYYNRKSLFKKTLESIQRQMDQISSDIEVIAVDDASDESERLEDLISIFPFLKIIRMEKQKKWYKNSCIPFNYGFLKSTGDVVIIQNPECLHFGNILKYTEANIQKNKYLSFACYSLDEEPTENIDAYLENPEKIKKLIEENNVENTKDGSNSWYNHSEIRPFAYHFCCAILKDDLVDLGGFDPLFANGVAYDDNELLFRIKLKKMDIEIIDSEIVLHLNHYKKKSQLNNSNLLNPKEEKKRSALLYKNEMLYKNHTQQLVDWRVDGLNLSILKGKSGSFFKMINFFKK